MKLRKSCALRYLKIINIAHMYVSLGKRVFDLVVTVPALIFLAPFMAIIAVLLPLSIHSKSSFYCQRRPGLHGRPFILYKYRTMTDERDAAGKLLPDSKRLTKLGSFLRSTSLDELLELINVLKGEMSLVGPRPLMMQYLARYTPEQMRRHEAMPGITGWAQVNGRNAITWEDKFKLDVWYVDHWSLWLDLTIIALTIWKVITREGISPRGHLTMPEFKGTD